MASGDRRGKHPHGRIFHHDVNLPPTRQARTDISPSQVPPVFRWVPDPRRCSSMFAWFVVMPNPTLRLIQGSLGSGNRAGGDCRTTGTTLGTGEGVVLVGERLLARECGMVEGECALGQVCMECDAIHGHVAFVRGDNLSRLRTFTAGWRRSLEFDQVLSGH
jgi:hypothetical protein